MATAAPRLPYAGVRVIEKAGMLSGRLTGMMFADQGAEVRNERNALEKR